MGPSGWSRKCITFTIQNIVFILEEIFKRLYSRQNVLFWSWITGKSAENWYKQGARSKPLTPNTNIHYIILYYWLSSSITSKTVLWHRTTTPSKLKVKGHNPKLLKQYIVNMSNMMSWNDQYHCWLRKMIWNIIEVWVRSKKEHRDKINI